MKRLEGFYWVEWNGRVRVAEWDGDSWYVTGSELPYDDGEVTVLSAAPLKWPGEGDAYTG